MNDSAMEAKMLLFVNACMREESRTERLARMWLEQHGDEDVLELVLAKSDTPLLDEEQLATYSASVAAQNYADPMFHDAKQFAQADEVLVAAPFWNYSIPAKLHDYLELVCSQGVTFDIDETGNYVSLCRAQRLTFVTTADGAEVDALDDHAFGYLRTLATRFWHIPEIACVAAWGLDGPDADVDALLGDALAGK